jgi:hypothetical protein
MTIQRHSRAWVGHAAGEHVKRAKTDRPQTAGTPDATRPMKETTGVGRFAANPNAGKARRAAGKPLTARQQLVLDVLDHPVAGVWLDAARVARISITLTTGQAAAALRELHAAGSVHQRDTLPGQKNPRPEWRAVT